MIKNTICFFFVWLLVSCNPTTNSSSIKVVGQMSDVMWKGELKGNIATDSLEGAKTYGLGPLAFLKGEIVLFEGQTFVSKVIDSSSHNVSNVPSARAPFFVYSTDSNLKVVAIKQSKYSLKELEQHIDSIYKNYDQPLLLRIDGVFDELQLHTVNLPQDTQVSSPEQAHQGLTTYNFNSIKGSLIAFFSRHHKAVFTHHDSFLHAHFISQDRQVLGHIDKLMFDSSEVSVKVSK